MNIVELVTDVIKSWSIVVNFEDLHMIHNYLKNRSHACPLRHEFKNSNY